MASRSSLPERLAARLERRIEQHAGLSVPRWVLASRVQARARASSLDTDAYVDRVCAADTAELTLLIEALRVGETRFFRHAAHITALTDVVIPALRQRPGTVRGWSAGCATGEEAYTLAMLLASGLPAPRYQVRVLGTDISDGALAVARAATYTHDALRHVPTRWRTRGFSRDGEDTYQIAPRIAKLVHFERQNLADARFPRDLDIIMCRNVLIYFSAEARRDVVRQLVDSLNDGGFLFVGYSESLRDVDDLELIRTADAVVYRKGGEDIPAIARPIPEPASAEASAEASDSVPVPVPASASGPVSAADHMVITLRGDYQTGDRLTKELSPALSGGIGRVIVALDGADYLSDEAAAVLRRAVSAARAAGVTLSLRAERPGTQRWLRRNELASGGDE